MDIILYNIIACLASLLIGYFFGSIPVGVILCRLKYGEDPREKGSKNSGGTNVGRLYGPKLGFLTILFDALKTIIPMFLVWIALNFLGIKDIFNEKLGAEMYKNGFLVILLAPLGSTLGHCWPIYSDFHGGKAVSSYAGFALTTCWLGFVVGFLTFGVALKKSKHVSLGSILGSISTSIVAWVLFAVGLIIPSANVDFAFWGFGIIELWSVTNFEYAIVSTLITAVLIFRHRKNIKRLADGCESKIKWMK